jgi:hypothetical protein
VEPVNILEILTLTLTVETAFAAVTSEINDSLNP